MKRFILTLGVLILSGLLIFLSCKKDDADPVDNLPVLTFMTEAEYVSSNTGFEVNSTFKVGVLGSNNPTTNINIATFKVIRNFSGISETVYKNDNVGESFFSWESNEVTNSELGEETWTFAITDLSGEKKELSFVITTQIPEALAPVITFTEGSSYVSKDTNLYTESSFTVGINASANPITNENIKNFEIKRTFDNITTIVYELSNFNTANFPWQETLYTNDSVGMENWNFIVTDHAGRTNELSFMLTTTIAPYIPHIYPTHYIENIGGETFLKIFIKCFSDDWEMETVIVELQGGSVSETYFGNGEVYLVNSEYIIPDNLPYIFGDWHVTITGIVKSGIHDGDSFTVSTGFSIGVI